MNEPTPARGDGERGSFPTKIVRAEHPVFQPMSSAAPLDGVLQLDAVHKELVHESFTCDTRDHEDHTCATSPCSPPTHNREPYDTLPSDPLPRDRFDARPGSHRPRRFCGMMFDVQAETGLPMEYVEVSSLSVGRLCIINRAGPPWPQRPIGPPEFSDGERPHLITPETSRLSRSPRRAGPPFSQGSQKTPDLMSDENLAPRPRRDVV